MTEFAWLRDVVVVNESDDIAVPGDVSVFRTAEVACAYLEYWWVENHEGFALTGDGREVVLGVRSSGSSTPLVVVGQTRERPDGERLLRAWLEPLAAALVSRRGVHANLDVAAMSIAELVIYIGFDR